MNSTEKWNKVCDYFDQYKAEPEEKVQLLWEKLFSEIFGYSSLDGEIEVHRKIQLGSTERLIPDIIIKNETEDLFMVELKREDLKIDDAKKKQLYSYLKQERNDLGVLICDQICLINYDYNKSDDEQEFCVIDFAKDNPIGCKFIEMFEKLNFTKDKAKKFIKECNTAFSNIDNIKKQLTSELIEGLVLNHFKNDFSESEVKFALRQFTFKIVSKVEQKNFAVLPTIKNEPYRYSHLLNSSNKTEEEKLIKTINSVGKETFVKYFEYYNNPQYETRDIKALFEKYENYKPNSMASKASGGKSIIKKGLAKEALTIILNAGNVSSEWRTKAREYLEQL